MTQPNITRMATVLSAVAANTARASRGMTAATTATSPTIAIVLVSSTVLEQVQYVLFAEQVRLGTVDN